MPTYTSQIKADKTRFYLASIWLVVGTSFEVLKIAFRNLSNFKNAHWGNSQSCGAVPILFLPFFNGKNLISFRSNERNV